MMRYRARLRDAKNPKRTVNVSLVAKSEKEARRLLKKYVPGLAGKAKPKARRKKRR